MDPDFHRIIDTSLLEWRFMESRARVASCINLVEGKMLNQSDVDLNYVHGFRDSSKETIKQTMLNQEIVFRKQVFELHQLYGVQIAMMEGFKQKGLDNHNLHNIGMSPVSVNQSKSSMKPVDLQLSADEFINQCVDDFSGKSQCVDDFSGKRVVTNLKEYFVSKNSSRDRVVFDLNHPNLSLSIGQNAKIMGGEHRCWKGNETCSSSIGIIDLEDVNLSYLKYEASLEVDPGPSALKSLSRGKHQFDNFSTSDKQNLESSTKSAIKGDSYRSILSRPFVQAGLSDQTKPSSDSGSNRHQIISSAAYPFNENQDSPSCKVDILDLNTAQLEELSCPSNDYSVFVHSSITSSSPMQEKVCFKSNVTSAVSPSSQREADVNQFTNLHGIYQQKDINPEKGEQCSKVGKLREGNGANISFVDLDSDSSGELCSSKSGPKNSSVGSSSKISNGLSCEMDLVDAVGVKIILEKRVKPFEHPDCCKLSSSSESDCMIDHQSSSIKTMQSAVECDDINISTSVEKGKCNIGPLVAHSGEQDLRSSDSTESNNHCINTKESKVDYTIQTAAELLMQISLVTEACCQGDLAEMPLKKIQNEEDGQPQCSLESYEAMVLKAEECSPDDYCVSSNAFVVDELGKKDVMYKLKRGTRMKDFQKDILPCLSTLSRHEIREDVNILEGIIRSREYKKMRANMGDEGGDWCRSTRSKRSRVGRRYYD